MTHADVVDPGPDGVPTGPAPTLNELGARISRLRAERSMSISTLAKLGALSPGLVSQIERGLGNPSYTTIRKLASALGVPASTFFAGEDANSKVGVVRAGNRRHLLFNERDIAYELLSPTTHGKLGAVLAHLEPHWANEDLPFQHEGEEWIMILEGEVMVNVAGTETELGLGDTITFDASHSHWCRNLSAATSTMLSVATPGSF